MIRAALSPNRNIGQGPVSGARYIPVYTVLAASLLIALPAVVGGIGTLWGPVLGAAILIPLTELTRSFIGGSGRGVDLIVYGGLIMMISLTRPDGLLGLFSRRKKEVAR